MSSIDIVVSYFSNDTSIANKLPNTCACFYSACQFTMLTTVQATSPWGKLPGLPKQHFSQAGGPFDTKPLKPILKALQAKCTQIEIFTSYI